MDLNENQLITLRVINCLLAALFTTNIIFILHNTIRYIHGLKIQRILIIMFYALIFCSTICRLFQCVVRIIIPKHGYFKYGHHAIQKIPGDAGNFFMVCLGFTLVVTMYQLTVSL